MATSSVGHDAAGGLLVVAQEPPQFTGLEAWQRGEDAGLVLGVEVADQVDGVVVGERCDQLADPRRGERGENLLRALLALHLGERLRRDLGRKHVEEADTVRFVQLLDEVCQVARMELGEEIREVVLAALLDERADAVQALARLFSDPGLRRAHARFSSGSRAGASAASSGFTAPAERM